MRVQAQRPLPPRGRFKVATVGFIDDDQSRAAAVESIVHAGKGAKLPATYVARVACMQARQCIAGACAVLASLAYTRETARNSAPTRQPCGGCQPTAA